jgi:predicted Zn finger-like uncharacterized protein
MSETKQTRCPFCSSVFNITTEQLAARGGHVRCGGCLQVFRADQHIVTGEAVVTTSAPTNTANPATTSGSTPVVARTQSASIELPLLMPPQNLQKNAKTLMMNHGQ